MRDFKNVKILATLGPSSENRETIRALAEAGADVFRLNMSHGDQDGQRAKYELIREIEQQLERPIGVLADLQGPKIRLGTFANGPHELSEGDRFRFDSDETPGDSTRVYLPHPEVLGALEKDATILINDGKVRLTVTEKHDGAVDAVVKVGGEISDRKGMNLPDVVLPLAALSEKDRSDLEFACELGADWIALSFVQRARHDQGRKTQRRHGFRTDPQRLGRHHGRARRSWGRDGIVGPSRDPETPDPRLP